MRVAESECIVRRILAIIWILLEEIFVQRSLCVVGWVMWMMRDDEDEL